MSPLKINNRANATTFIPVTTLDVQASEGDHPAASAAPIPTLICEDMQISVDLLRAAVSMEFSFLRLPHNCLVSVRLLQLFSRA